jgi:hypothetical protein
MTIPKSTDDAGTPHEGRLELAEELAVDALAGAAAGAAAGALAGPPGMVIGAVIGGAVGAVAGEVRHMDHVEAAARDEQLDRDIGVSGGDLGAAPADQPPSRGVFHATSLGVSTGTSPWPAEGPIQDLDDD